MVTNENNSYISSFTKGMNSDGAFDLMLNTQYIFGQNVRITKNQFLNGHDDYSSVHEGIVAPVPEGIVVQTRTNLSPGERILSVASIQRLAVIVTTKNNKDINVYRFTVNEENNTFSDFQTIWHADNIWKNANAPGKISTVLYEELENVIKLYIATGEHPIISMRVDDQRTIQVDTDVNDLINNRIIPDERVFVEDVTSGRLVASQVQYTYRLYNKYGNSTQLAPLTNKIQVIDPSRSKQIGNAENTETSIGLSLSINIQKYRNRYNRLQVFRLSYIIPGQDAEVALIYDGEVNSDKFILNDVGIDPLQTLSMAEFSAMSGIIIIPKVIEQNQEYMFCGNIKDDTIIRGVNIQLNVPYNLIKAQVVLSDKVEGDIPNPGNYSYYAGDYNSLINMSGTAVGQVSDYLKQRGINPQLVKASYNNMFTSSLLRSLRRGETYKYAIIFYDKYGRRTDVKNICDVNVSSYRSSRPFGVDNDKLIAYPIGVNIDIPQLDLSNSDISPSDIIGCQIVRRSSSEIYQKTLLQVALARPISQGLLELRTEDWSTITEDSVKKSPYYPTGFLMVSASYIFPNYYMPSGDPSETQLIDTSFYMIGDAGKALAAKTNNHKLFQIFSSEIDFRRQDVLSRVNTSDSTIQEVLYIPAVFAKYTNGEKQNVYDGTSPVNPKYDDRKTVEFTTIDGFTPDDGQYVCSSTIGMDGKIWYYISYGYLDLNKSITFLVDSSDITRGTLMYVDPNSTGSTDADHIIYGPEIYLGLDVSTNRQVMDFIRTAMNSGRSLFLVVNNVNPIPTLTVDIQGRGEYDNQDEGYIVFRRDRIPKLSADEKLQYHYIFNFFETQNRELSGFGTNNVNQIKDVKVPNWDSGFTEVYRDNDQHIASAIKKYKSYSTNIDSFSYNNWVSFCKYDLRPGNQSAPNMDGWDGDEAQELIGTRDDMNLWLESDWNTARCGYIGAGPSCFLLTTEKETGMFPLLTQRFYTSICNIQHNPKITDVQSDDFVEYYGFGNYFPLTYKNNRFYTADDKTYFTVFDGDVYITPHEFTTCYKAYDFNSVDTLQSTQVTNYIPLESKVNTCFDYGMNMINTQSENLIFESGHIDGVNTQERPAHQYNMIYSDNDASNDIFTLITTDENETNDFKQRSYYSDLKTNGEYVDNFLIFKAAAFIDVDSKYGQITNLLTDKNILYYWQDHACGKFSVNERSLINDQNSNTIMLGQAGILSRYDYISTRYGMRLYDFCAKSTETGVFWVDINNKAVVGLDQAKAINYGENLNVQNIINNNITSDIPKVDFDLLNDELLCKCFGNDQIVFSTKYNIATSNYTRQYSDMVYIKNHLYGISISNTGYLNMVKYNYLNYGSYSYLSPMKLEFIVNPNASITKVFDSQQLIPIKRDQFTSADHANVLNNTTMSFETDIVNKAYGNDMEPYTDREGNIIYNIPRWSNEGGYGHRIRGKWLRVNINNTNPTEYFTLSHIVTKFRQSYS